MKIAGILFDKDGTLFDFQKTWGKWAKVFLTEISNNNIEEAIKLGNHIGYNYRTEEFLSDSVVIAGTPKEIANKIISFLPKWNIIELINYINEVQPWHNQFSFHRDRWNIHFRTQHKSL